MMHLYFITWFYIFSLFRSRKMMWLILRLPRTVKSKPKRTRWVNTSYINVHPSLKLIVYAIPKSVSLLNAVLLTLLSKNLTRGCNICGLKVETCLTISVMFIQVNDDDDDDKVTHASIRGSWPTAGPQDNGSQFYSKNHHKWVKHSLIIHRPWIMMNI